MAVNIIKTKKIVSMEVAKEDVVDGKMLKPFTRQAVLLIRSSASCKIIIMYENKQGGRRRCL